MNVLWLCDEKGWAYDNASSTLARQMPQHKHRFVYYKHPYQIDAAWPDVVVSSHPEVAKRFPQLAGRMVCRFSTRTFRLTPHVLWFCDERGWAYDQRARLLAAHLPDYRHHFGYYFDFKTDAERRQLMLRYDIVVCMCAPYAMAMHGKFDHAVVSLAGHRLLKLMGIEVDYA